MLTIIEDKYIKLKNHEIKLTDFEEWVYSSEDIENMLKSDDYTDLISIDYRKKTSVNEVERILDKYIDYSKYYNEKILEMLKMIKVHHENTGEILREIYDMYCHGCEFLRDLGLEYGLTCEVPPSANSWDELSDQRKLELVESFYPQMDKYIDQVTYWINEELVKIEKYDERHMKYIVKDLRNV